MATTELTPAEAFDMALGKGTLRLRFPTDKDAERFRMRLYSERRRERKTASKIYSFSSCKWDGIEVRLFPGGELTLSSSTSVQVL